MMRRKSICQSAFFMGLLFCFARGLFASGASIGAFQPSVAALKGNKLQHDMASAMGPVFRDLDLMLLGQFDKTGSLNTARTDHAATLLPNGFVLVEGGEDTNFNVVASAELYDPASGTWTNTGNLNIARRNHTATLLANGMVLAAAGVDSNFNALLSAELYDPASGSWTATSSLNTARSQHTGTLLPNGMVLVAGGFDGGALTSAELYNPLGGSWTPTGSLNTARYLHTA